MRFRLDSRSRYLIEMQNAELQLLPKLRDGHRDRRLENREGGSRDVRQRKLSQFQTYRQASLGAFGVLWQLMLRRTDDVNQEERWSEKEGRWLDEDILIAFQLLFSGTARILFSPKTLPLVRGRRQLEVHFFY